MEPTLRGSRLGDPRFRASGLTASDADAFLPPLLTYADGSSRTAAELRTWLEEHLGATTALDSSGHRMLRHYVPLWHAPTGCPWSFDTRQSYVAASPPAPPSPTRTRPRQAYAH
ncbi:MULTISPECIES: hypothetical protein [unclassified Streptomyces]|uniref:hypothetical protein n=1 Tax=unclassified Streptomyces TaxID=2593676 RepID=UPI002E18DDE6|nr:MULTISPECIES: hypothetical protein [unclassified Streptomyces]